MNSLERVATTLQFKEPDRVPVYPIISGVSRNLIGADYKTWATNAEVCAEALIKATEELDIDCIVTLTDLSVEAADFGQALEYPENEAARPVHYDRFIKEIEDYGKIKPIDPRVTPRMSEHIKLCKILMEKKGQDTPVVAFVFGPLGILSMLRGQEDIFMDIYDDREAIMNAQEAITQTLEIYCDELIKTGVHAIMFDTLFASQSIMSKEMWLELEGGFVERLAKRVHDQGCMVMIHNCGLGIYFDAQIEMMKPEAISFLHLPDDCKSFEELKEKYGKKTTLIGHIQPPWIIKATAEEIYEECKKEFEVLGKGGGFVLATGCEYPANASLDGARAMIKAAKEMCVYK